MTTAIEVAIGLILLYLTLSLIVAAINEGIAALFGMRARFLERGIKNLLGDAMKGKFYEHGLVRALTNPEAPEDKQRPSYISKSTFSSVTLDLISKIPPPSKPGADSDTPANSGNTTGSDTDDGSAAADDDALTSLKAVTRRLGEIAAQSPPPVRAALEVFAREAADIEELKSRLEGWFDEAMERVSGWYKRWTKIIVFCVGLVVCVALNADTLNVAKVLWTDDAVRAAVVAAAEETAKEEETPDLTAQEAARAVGDLAELQIPLGWIDDQAESSEDDTAKTEGRDPREVPDDFGGILLKALGIIITAIALTFGAPFWFDLLKRFVSLRSSGDPEEDARTKEGSGSGATAPASTGG